MSLNYIFNALFRDTPLAYFSSCATCHVCHVMRVTCVTYVTLRDVTKNDAYSQKTELNCFNKLKPLKIKTRLFEIGIESYKNNSL